MNLTLLFIFFSRCFSFNTHLRSWNSISWVLSGLSLYSLSKNRSYWFFEILFWRNFRGWRCRSTRSLFLMKHRLFILYSRLWLNNTIILRLRISSLNPWAQCLFLHYWRLVRLKWLNVRETNSAIKHRKTDVLRN